MVTREAVVAEARTWAEPPTPWHHQASLKGVGCDCIGLIAGVDIALGLPEGTQWINDIRYKGYGPTPDPKLLIEACDTYMDRIPINAASLGDVLVMSFERDPQHFAFISRLNPHYLIHSYAQARKVVENGINVAGATILRAYHLRGVE